MEMSRRQLKMSVEFREVLSTDIHLGAISTETMETHAMVEDLQ